MNHTFSWMQLQTTDSKKAQTFYGSLFNWTLQTQTIAGGQTHTTIDAGDGPFGGIAQIDKNSPPHWITYINVDDIKTYTDKAKNLGAEIIVPVTDIGGGQGYYCVFKDPTGAFLGLWAPK